jgi:hypothetical protein
VTRPVGKAKWLWSTSMTELRRRGGEGDGFVMFTKEEGM